AAVMLHAAPARRGSPVFELPRSYLNPANWRGFFCLGVARRAAPSLSRRKAAPSGVCGRLPPAGPADSAIAPDSLLTASPMAACQPTGHDATLPDAPCSRPRPSSSESSMKSQPDAASRVAAEVVTQLPVPSRLGMLRFERLNEASWAMLYLDPV